MRERKEQLRKKITLMQTMKGEFMINPDVDKINSLIDRKVNYMYNHYGEMVHPLRRGTSVKLEKDA